MGRKEERIITFKLEQRLPNVTRKEKTDIIKLNRAQRPLDYNKRATVPVTSSQEEKRKKVETEKVFEKIMAGNTINLLGDRQNYGFNKLRENQRG